MLKKLMQIRDEAKKELKALLEKTEAEGRLFSDEEKALIVELKAKASEAEAQIEEIKDLDLDESKASNFSDEGNLSVSTTQAAATMTRVVAEPAKKEFESVDEFLATVYKNPNDQRLNYVEAQRTDEGSSGGFAIPQAQITEIRKFEPDELLVRSRAMVLPGTGSAPDAELPMPALDQSQDGASSSTGGVEAQWLGEGADKPKTKFRLRQIMLKPHEIAAIIPFTDKLLRNLGSATTFGSMLLRQAINEAEELAYFLGNAVAKPLGALVSGAAYIVARDEAGLIKLVDLKNMFIRFKGDPRKALWVVDRLSFVQLLNMVGDGSGSTNIIDPSNPNPIYVDKASGQMTIYGIPVVISDFVSALGVQGDISLNDFSKYYIKDGSGPIVEMGHDTGDFRANKTSMKVTWNTDGKPMLQAPLKTKQNVEVSPFVVLGDTEA